LPLFSSENMRWLERSLIDARQLIAAKLDWTLLWKADISLLRSMEGPRAQGTGCWFG
jgi:hypothetical protein